MLQNEIFCQSVVGAMSKSFKFAHDTPINRKNIPYKK